MIARRAFLTGLIAAPVIIKYESLMPIKQVLLQPRYWRKLYHGVPITEYNRDFIANERDIADTYHRILNPVLVIREGGDIDVTASIDLEAATLRRLRTLLDLKARYEENQT